MTTLTFSTRAGRVTGVAVSGHAMPETAEGPDLACCAVTSAVRLAECVLNDAAGVGAETEVWDGEEPLVALRVPEGLSEAEDELCQAVLAGLMVYAVQLHEEYPSAVSVRASDPADKA